MAHKYIQSPFSLGSLDKRVFASDAEVAAIFCLAEGRRKKKGFLSSNEEKMGFLWKANYPVYAMRSRNRSIFFDGLGLISENVLYRDIIDSEQFEKELSIISKVGPLRAFLTKHAKTFSDFKGSRSMRINNIISNQSLLSEMTDFVQKSSFKTPTKDTAVIFRVDKQMIYQIVSEFNDLIEQVEGGLESLEKISKSLRSSIDRAIQKVRDDKQKDFEKLNQEFEKLKPIVEDKIDEIRKNQEEDIKKLTEAMNKDSDVIYEKKNMYEKDVKRMNRLEDEANAEKKALSQRNDSIGEEYWSKQATKNKDFAADLMKAIKASAEKIEKIQFRFNASLKRLNEKNEKEIRNEEERLIDLEIKRDADSDMKDMIINELEHRNSRISSQISKLCESKEKDKSKLMDMTTSWSPDKNCVILIQLYIAKYENGSRTRYEVFAPAIVKSYSSFKKGRRAFTGLESKLLHLLTPVGSHFEEFFTKGFGNLITTNSKFEDAILKASSNINLFKESGRGKLFGNGLDILKKEGWLSNQEYKKMLFGLNIAFKLASSYDPDFELEESKSPSPK